MDRKDIVDTEKETVPVSKCNILITDFEGVAVTLRMEGNRDYITLLSELSLDPGLKIRTRILSHWDPFSRLERPSVKVIKSFPLPICSSNLDKIVEVFPSTNFALSITPL